MEANREAAVQCVARAEAALLENDYERALRLFVKAQSLYPLEGLETKIDSAQAFQDGAAQQSRQSPPPPPPPRPPSPPPAPYISTTPSDAEVARVLRSSGCHYAVLGLARTVLAADLKKNYHRLCHRMVKGPPLIAPQFGSCASSGPPLVAPQLGSCASSGPPLVAPQLGSCASSGPLGSAPAWLLRLLRAPW